MRRTIASLIIAASTIVPLTIGEYVSRTMSFPHINSFCQRYDSGHVESTIFWRERLSKMRLSEEQINKRAAYQMRGSSFARDAAYAADVRTCRNHNYKKYSRSRRRI